MRTKNHQKGTKVNNEVNNYRIGKTLITIGIVLCLVAIAILVVNFLVIRNVSKHSLESTDVLASGESLDGYKPTDDLTDADKDDEYQKNYQESSSDDGSYLIKSAEWTDRENGEAVITLRGKQIEELEETRTLYVATLCYSHGLTEDIVTKNIMTLIKYYDYVDFIGIGDSGESGIADVKTFTADSTEEEIQSYLEEIRTYEWPHYIYSIPPAIEKYLFGNIGDEYISEDNLQHDPVAIYVSTDTIYPNCTSKGVELYGVQYATEKYFNFIEEKYGDRYFTMSQTSKQSDSPTCIIRYADRWKYDADYLNAVIGVLNPECYGEADQVFSESSFERWEEWDDSSNASINLPFTDKKYAADYNYDQTFEEAGVQIITNCSISDVVSSYFDIESVDVTGASEDYQLIIDGQNISFYDENYISGDEVVITIKVKLKDDEVFNFEDFAETNEGNAVLAGADTISVGSPVLMPITSSYTVNYLEEGTNKVLATSKVEENVPINTVVQAEDEVIDIDGYKYDSSDKDSITISSSEDGVINIYYTKRTDLTYTVNYYEKDTTNKVADSKVVTNQTFGDSVTEEALDIYGFYKIEPTTQTITITSGTNEINFYYERIPAYITVRYVDKNTGKEIADEATLTGVVGATFDVSEKKQEISGYTLVEEPETTTGEYTEDPQEFTYYYAKNTSVIVKYLEIDDTEDDLEDNVKLKDEVEISGYVGKTYDTDEYESDISGYTLVSTTKNTSGKMTEDQIVVVYYYAQNTDVVIRYVDKYSNEELAKEETISGYEGKAYDTEDYEKQITDYTLVEDSGNTSGEMTKDEIVVTYYYAKNTSVVVKYLEQDTDKVLKEETTISGYVGKEYATTEASISNYECVEVVGDETGTMTEDQIVVIYYYAQKTNLIVQHIDRETGELLAEETVSGVVGQIVKTQAKDIEDYVCVETPENEDVELTKEEQVVKYYYAHVSAGVIEKHIDIITGDLIEPSVAHEGVEGEEYNIESKEFDGYDLVTSKLPANSRGEMLKDEVIEVKYYYIKKAKVTVEYVEKTTGDKIAEDSTINGHENDYYSTYAKTIDGYDLVGDSGNTEGNMTVTVNSDGTYDVETVVTYYYLEIAGGVVENHIDVTTNEVLETNEYTGDVGDFYETSSIEIDGYDLVESKYPTNSSGTMTKDEIEVNYYYIKRATVTVNYVDELTGKIISTEEITGHIGDSYKTSSEEFDGYDLSKEPDNKQGTMNDVETVVTYYYKKKAEVEVKYVEKETGYEISSSDMIDGYVGDAYSTSEKQIDYYTFIGSTENASGSMTEDEIEVTYYYQRKPFNLGVDKWVESVNMNGVTTSAQDANTKDEITKLEIRGSKVDTADITVTYKIRINNTGEIEGTVGKLLDVIPDGYSFYQEDNEVNWEYSDGVLTTYDFKDTVIEPGESIEIELVLRWNGGQDNLGTAENKVILSEINNPAGFRDEVAEDNYDTATMMLTVATGLDNNDKVVMLCVLQALVIVLCICLIIKHKIKK